MFPWNAASFYFMIHSSSFEKHFCFLGIKRHSSTFITGYSFVFALSGNLFRLIFVVMMLCLISSSLLFIVALWFLPSFLGVACLLLPVYYSIPVCHDGWLKISIPSSSFPCGFIKKYGFSYSDLPFDVLSFWNSTEWTWKLIIFLNKWFWYCVWKVCSLKPALCCCSLLKFPTGRNGWTLCFFYVNFKSETLQSAPKALSE